MPEIYATDGVTAEGVETTANDAGHLTPILTYSPPQGTWLRIFNNVAQGVAEGLPIFLDLRDANGNKLPQNTHVVLRAKYAGMSRPVEVSTTLQSISFWNMNTITEQQNSEQYDHSKVELEYPEASGRKNEDREHVDIRDIDEFQVAIEGSTVVDMSQSTVEFESDGISDLRTRN